MARLARAVLLVAAVAASGGSSSLVEPPPHLQGALPQRAAPVVNVRDFGAVADGKTDSSGAFRAALAHAATLSSPSARATVVVPGDADGRRYLVANVSLPSDVDVAGDAGAAILMPASALFALCMNASTALRGVDFVIVSPSPLSSPTRHPMPPTILPRRALPPMHSKR
eukprot:COSAG04_NODE_3693_length_2600_cov_3.309476_2_plen_169_part_00